MQDLFPADRFLRVHKSFIINLQKVQQLDRNSIFLNGQQVPIGRNFREALEKFIKSR
ncbi:LytTr DNA-binding domain protein [compost metagenome]